MSDKPIYQLIDRQAVNQAAYVPVSDSVNQLASNPSTHQSHTDTDSLPSPNQPWWRRLLHVLLWVEPFWIATLMPSLLFRDLFWDQWTHPWLIAALFLFWPVRLLADRRLAPATPLNPPIFALLLWSSVGIWMASDPVRAWQAEGLLALGVALYVALINWPPTQRRPWLVVLLLVGCGLLLTTIGPEILPSVPSEFFVFSSEVTKSKPINYFGIGETINPNVLAGGLLLPIPLLVTLAIRTSWARRRWLAPLLLLPALPILVTLILVQSRGSYLALIIALMVVVTLRWPWGGVAMSIAMLTTTVVLIFDGALRLLNTFGSDGSLTSFSGRVEIWQGTLAALVPYGLTGVGMGNFELVVPAYFSTWTASIPHAHNLFLQIAVDLGWPGLLLYGWLLIRTYLILVQILRNDGYVDEVVNPTDEKPRRRTASARPPRSSANQPALPQPFKRQPVPSRAQQRRAEVYARRSASLRWALAAGLCATLTGMVIHGLVDAVTWNTKLAFIPWLLYALAALLWLQAQATNAVHTPSLD